jgi:hypothetical protein
MAVPKFWNTATSTGGRCLGHPAGQVNAAAHAHDVDVLAGAFEQQVADEPADDVGFHPLLDRTAGNQFKKRVFL